MRISSFISRNQEMRLWHHFYWSRVCYIGQKWHQWCFFIIIINLEPFAIQKTTLPRISALSAEHPRTTSGTRPAWRLEGGMASVGIGPQGRHNVLRHSGQARGIVGIDSDSLERLQATLTDFSGKSQKSLYFKKWSTVQVDLKIPHRCWMLKKSKYSWN